jgi:dienelactone hydrolase
MKHIKFTAVMITCLSFSCSQEKSGTVISSGYNEILSLPAVSGSFIIDGRTDDEIWALASRLDLVNNKNSLYDQGGSTWIAVRGRYLCLSAKLPDSGRLVAHSSGINPVWWREDLIIWKLRYRSSATGRNMVLIFSVNPFGAFSAGLVKDIYNISRNDIFAATPPDWSGEILAAAGIGKEGWMAEAALPLEHLDTIGFISVERIRAPRVNTPELNWYWPAAEEQSAFNIKESTQAPVPMLMAPDLKQINLNPSDLLPPDKMPSTFASLPGQVWTGDVQKSPGVSGVKRMLENSLRTRVKDYALEEKKEWQSVRTAEDWRSFRDKRIKALLDFIGPMPDRTPLKPEITGRIDYGDGFVIENIVFESRPGLMVTANLYLPEEIKKQIPAIVVVHSHHAPKTQSELQDMGMTWARAGVAVLVMDQLCAGERIQSQPWPRESYYGRYNLGDQLYLAGESLIKWMAWDIIRGIDLLAERKYIDRGRIILLGAVAGGGDPAALAANLDDRIAALIPFNFGEAGPEEHYTEGPRPYDFETADPGWAFWETTRNMPGSISGQFFPWFICAAGAPREFILSFEVGWPAKIDEEPAWARYKKVYSLLEAEDHLAAVDGYGPFPGPGECTNVGTFLRKRLYPVLNRWLGVPAPEAEYHRILPEEKLMCLTPATCKTRELKPASQIALDIAKERYSVSESHRSVMSFADRAGSLRRDLMLKLGDIEPEKEYVVEKLLSEDYKDFTLESYSIETEPGIALPLFLLLPDKRSPLCPAVIALGEGGKEHFLSMRQTEISSLLKNGMAVCLPDVRGTGELAASASRGPGAMSLAANVLMLGGTLTGSRLKDSRTIFRWLGDQPGIDPEKISFWGDSFSVPNNPGFEFHQSPGQQPGPVPQRQAEPLGPFLALLSALYEESSNAVACRGGLISFSSVLEDNFCHIPQDVIVPGFLTVADIKDLVRSVIPRPVLIAEPVNGLNIRVSPGSMENEYGGIGDELMLADDAGGDLVAIWLIRQSREKQQ